MISHQTLRRLVYFAAIADAGSIRGAATRLNLSVPVLSEALSELEAELGVSLATRTTRHFELTEAGERTQLAAQTILESANGLSDLTSTTPQLDGTLCLTVPVEVAGFWLPQKLKAFRQKHPKVTFDVDVTDDVIDLRTSKVEVAIRTDYVPPHAPPRSAVNLPLVVVANGAIAVGEDGVVEMPLIDSQTDRKLFATPRDGGAMCPLTFSRTDRITNRSAALQLARHGLGAVMVMRGSVVSELASGALSAILPDHDFGSVDLNCQFRDRLPSQTALIFAREIGLAP